MTEGRVMWQRACVRMGGVQFSARQLLRDSATLQLVGWLAARDPLMWTLPLDFVLDLWQPQPQDTEDLGEAGAHLLVCWRLRQALPHPDAAVTQAAQHLIAWPGSAECQALFNAMRYCCVLQRQWKHDPCPAGFSWLYGGFRQQRNAWALGVAYAWRMGWSVCATAAFTLGCRAHNARSIEANAVGETVDLQKLDQGLQVNARAACWTGYEEAQAVGLALQAFVYMTEQHHHVHVHAGKRLRKDRSVAANQQRFALDELRQEFARKMDLFLSAQIQRSVELVLWYMFARQEGFGDETDGDERLHRYVILADKVGGTFTE